MKEGLVVIPSKPLSEEIKAKVKLAMDKRSSRLTKLVESMRKDFEEGAFNNVINKL